MNEETSQDGEKSIFMNIHLYYLPLPPSLPPSLPHLNRIQMSIVSIPLVRLQHGHLDPHPSGHPRQCSLCIFPLHPPYPGLPCSLPLPLPRPQYFFRCSCPVALQKTSTNRRCRRPSPIRPEPLGAKIIDKPAFCQLLASLPYQGGRKGGREGAEDDSEAISAQATETELLLSFFRIPNQETGVGGGLVGAEELARRDTEATDLVEGRREGGILVEERTA